MAVYSSRKENLELSSAVIYCNIITGVTSHHLTTQQNLHMGVIAHHLYLYIYIYTYSSVCVCVCVSEASDKSCLH